MTKNVDDQLGICSAVFKSQNSKWPPHERKNGIKSLKMTMGTYAVNQFYVFFQSEITIIIYNNSTETILQIIKFTCKTVFYMKQKYHF